jgi:hypothetical protein
MLLKRKGGIGLRGTEKYLIKRSAWNGLVGGEKKKRHGTEYLYRVFGRAQM